MIGLIFKREMKSFFGSPAVWLTFLLQPLFLCLLSLFILNSLQKVLESRPQALELMTTRYFSILLLGYSLICVIFMVIRNLAIEKATGLLDTLFSTPLQVRQWVWGKSLQLAVLGYSAGLFVSAFAVGSMMALTGRYDLLGTMPGYYWAFALLGAPIILSGMLIMITYSSLLTDSRVVMTLFSMGSTLLFFLGNWYQNARTEQGLMVLFVLAGLFCHTFWWIAGNRIKLEKVIS